MNTTSTQAAHRSRLETLLLIRRWIAIAMFSFSVLLGVLWVWPKGSVGPVWLVCLVPAALILWVQWRAAPPNSEFRVPLGRALGLSAVLLALWVGGIFVMDAWGPESWFLAGLWGWLAVIWPVVTGVGLLARFVVRQFIPAARKKDSIDERRRQESAYAERMTRETNSQIEPTAPGRATGFEPSALESIDPIPGPLMYGTPGAGLSGSGFGADRIAKGQQGEANFARALQRTGMLSRFATFWSVHMPDESVGASATLKADIDVIVVTGRSIILLDIKNYTQGDVTWFVEDGKLRMLDNPTGGYVGMPREMSRSMELALSRMREKFEGLGVRRPVTARVVFMPTDNGMGVIADGVKWPGKIPALPLDRVLGELSNEPDFLVEAKDSQHILPVLRWLVKDESGSAPRAGEAWRTAPGMQRARTGSRPTASHSSATGYAPATPARATEDGQSADATPPATAPVAGTPTATPVAREEHRDSRTEPSTRRCPECGAVFQPEWTFCWGCGRA